MHDTQIKIGLKGGLRVQNQSPSEVGRAYAISEYRGAEIFIISSIHSSHSHFLYVGYSGHVEQRFLPETNSSFQLGDNQTMR